MSDQPTPTTDDVIERLNYIVESPSSEHGGFHENAIQAAKDAISALSAERTGEWTTTSKGIAWANSGAEISMDNLNLVILHNAAIAAERDTYVKQREDWISEIQQLREQLAADREKVQTLVDALKFYARTEHWMGLTDDTDAPQTNLIAHGKVHPTGNGYDVAKDALAQVGK